MFIFQLIDLSPGLPKATLVSIHLFTKQPFSVLFLCDIVVFQILYMLTLSTQSISISNVFNAIYVDTVDTKHIHTFLLITFLIFNGFSICKKF